MPTKPGRNEPCWCGSGKKYKHCHLKEDQQTATVPPPTGATALESTARESTRLAPPEPSPADLALDAEWARFKQADLDGTPFFVINGYVISGVRPFAVFEQVVTRALAESELAKGPTAKP